MENSEKNQFVQVLTETMAAYGKPLPEQSILLAWWNCLVAYPLRIVAAAFTAYCDESGEFAPAPAGIAMRCKLMDGRPGPEEAWAIALTSRDEADTVVWTAEIAEAFVLCQPVLSMGDEVGARMAFKESYVRIVAAARAARCPAQWTASLGWDLSRRKAALVRASNAGLLPAPSVAALLPAPINEPLPDTNARAQIAKIRQMLADTAMSDEALADAAIEFSWRRGEQQKAEITAKVAAHRASA